MYGATNAAHLNVRDINNGALHEVYFTFPDGRKMNMMHVITLNAKTEKEKKKLRVLGMIQSNDKSLGTNHSGTMTCYDITSEFREWLIKYESEGIDLYGTMDVISCDPTSSSGRQSLTYYDVNFDSADLANIDINASEMTTELPFTYSRVDINEKYTELDGLF